MRIEQDFFQICLEKDFLIQSTQVNIHYILFQLYSAVFEVSMMYIHNYVTSENAYHKM